MAKKRKFLVGGLIVFVAMSYLGYMGISSSATYYFEVSELLEQGSSICGRNVLVNGQVAPDSVVEEPGSFTLRFTLTEGEVILPVVYQGVIPDAFKAGIEVVVEGYLNSTGIFQASTILTKCPSRYAPQNRFST